MADLYLPDAETAYTRSVLLAVELLDAVTLEPVTRAVQVSAPPLAPSPFVNASGRFVWLLTGPLRPTRVIVEPGTLPYDREDVAAPPLPAILLPATERLLRIWLRPRRGYRYADGVTVVSGRLVEGTVPAPAPVPRADVWLEWRDDAGAWRALRARTFTRVAGADRRRKAANSPPSCACRRRTSSRPTPRACWSCASASNGRASASAIRRHSRCPRARGTGWPPRWPGTI